MAFGEGLAFFHELELNKTSERDFSPVLLQLIENLERFLSCHCISSHTLSAPLSRASCSMPASSMPCATTAESRVDVMK